MEPFDLTKWPRFRDLVSCCPNTFIDEVAIDSRHISSKHSLFVALSGNRKDGHHFIEEAALKGAKFALIHKNYSISKNNSTTLLKVDDPLIALQEIATYYRKERKALVLAICGSYGKTMTKDLLFAILRKKWKVHASPESFNSQIGVALSLLMIREHDEIALIETAFSKAEEMQKLAKMVLPDFTILTSLEKRYLDTLTLDDSVKEHLKMIEATSEKGWALLPHSQIDSRQVKCKLFFSEGVSCNLPTAKSVDRGGYRIHFSDFPSYNGKLPFEHHSLIPLINRSIKALSLFGFSSEEIQAGLESYTPEPRHVELWLTPCGITVVNDVYSSDPLSIRKALMNLPARSKLGKKVFVFGGFREERSRIKSFSHSLISELRSAKIDLLILIGSKEEISWTNCQETLLEPSSFKHFEKYEDAYSFLRSNLHHGDIVLFKGKKKTPTEEIARSIWDNPCENRLVINLAAIRSNLALIRTKLPHKTRIMIMVKAKGYGTDPGILGDFLSKCGIDILGVAHVDEAIALKQRGVNQAIFVLNIAPFEAEKLVKHDFEVGISDETLIEILEHEASLKQKKISVHLHVDTGMGRFGCRPDKALDLAKKIINSSSLELVGLMTHLAAADFPEEDHFTYDQIAKFQQVLKTFHEHSIYPRWIHAANSSGMLRFDFPFCNMIRLGLAPFGISSCKEEKHILPFKIALSLHSRLAGINICKKGETISYGRTYKVEKAEQKIGIVPLGYFDGLHRHYSGKGYVLVRGKPAKMIGRICMDFMMIDLSDIEDVQKGDPVLIFGEDIFGNMIFTEEVASWGNTDVRELISCLGPRIQRFFIDEES